MKIWRVVRIHKFLIWVMVLALALAIGFGYFAKKFTTNVKKISEAEGSVYFEKARKAQEEGDLQKAKELYEKALQAGDNEAYLEKYAQVSYGLQQFDDSIESYTKLLKQRQDSASTWNSIGNVYRDNGNSDKAIESYQKAIATDSHYIVAYTNLINLYLLQANNEKAKEVLEQGLKANPNDANLAGIRKNIK